jgi:hypothetical protein
MSEQSAITKMANAELAKVEGSMKPQLDKLSKQVDSTELIDDARANSAARSKGAQGAATRARSAGGGQGTTRQQMMDTYKARLDSNKAQVGAVNHASLNQSKANEGAQTQLSELNTQLSQTAMNAKLDAATADQDYAMHKENLRTQKDNGKKSFWGKVAGTAVGIGASLLI